MRASAVAVTARRGVGGEQLGQATQGAVLGAEVVAPLADAMGLVDGDQGQRQGLQARQHRGLHQSLGRDVQQVQLARRRPPPHRVALFGHQAGIQPRGGHARLLQRRHLVGHQGDQRRDHQGQAVQHQGGDLVAQALAAAGGQHGQGRCAPPASRRSLRPAARERRHGRTPGAGSRAPGPWVRGSAIRRPRPVMGPWSPGLQGREAEKPPGRARAARQPAPPRRSPSTARGWRGRRCRSAPSPARGAGPVDFAPTPTEAVVAGAPVSSGGGGAASAGSCVFSQAASASSRPGVRARSRASALVGSRGVQPWRSMQLFSTAFCIRRRMPPSCRASESSADPSAARAPYWALE